MQKKIIRFSSSSSRLGGLRLEIKWKFILRCIFWPLTCSRFSLIFRWNLDLEWMAKLFPNFFSLFGLKRNIFISEFTRTHTHTHTKMDYKSRLINNSIMPKRGWLIYFIFLGNITDCEKMELYSLEYLSLKNVYFPHLSLSPARGILTLLLWHGIASTTTTRMNYYFHIFYYLYYFWWWAPHYGVRYG